MDGKMVKANTSFRGFFTLGSTGRMKWVEISEGTDGILEDKKVTFEFGRGDTASAPVEYSDQIGNTERVHHSLITAA